LVIISEQDFLIGLVKSPQKRRITNIGHKEKKLKPKKKQQQSLNDLVAVLILAKKAVYNYG